MSIPSMSLPALPVRDDREGDLLAQARGPNNLDMTVGKLYLTDKEENQIVAFLQNAHGRFTRPYPTSIRTPACA